MELRNYSNKLKNALISGYYNDIPIENIMRGGGALDGRVLTDMNYQPSSYGAPMRKTRNMRPGPHYLDGGKETKLMKSLKRVGRNLGHKLIDEGEKIGNNLIKRSSNHLEKVGTKYIDNVASNQYNSIPEPQFESDYWEGGKSSAFVKSLKRVGNQLGKTAMSEGTKVGQTLIKTAAKNATKAGQQYINNLMNPQIIEENPELLAAAGFKKPKRKRILSAKEKARHELIRHLMSNKGLSFGEASHYIKAKNLKY